MTAKPQWLKWARKLQALGQTGVTYSLSVYDTQRYEQLLEIASEMLAAHTDHEKASILQSFTMQVGYATPKIDVRGAVIHEGRILLVQERSDNHWCLPGGWADVGAAPAEMVVREVKEESGFDVTPKRIVGIYDGNRNQKPLEFYHAYKIVFLCELFGGEAQPSEETMAVNFFDFDALPPLSNNRTNERHLQDVRTVVQTGQQLTVFD
jgi:ADP-ribose pyrophosphatase YjhB (NUDIX family)